MRVREEIEQYSPEEDRPALIWLLTRYRLSSQWAFVDDETHELRNIYKLFRG